MLVNPNQIVSTDRLQDELWGETGAGKQNALWVHVSNLRTALEPDRPVRSEGTILLTRSPGYLLRVESAELDSAQFELLVTEGQGLLSSDPPAAALVFAEALALLRPRSTGSNLSDSTRSRAGSKPTWPEASVISWWENSKAWYASTPFASASPRS
jgi:hypothetical protein